MVGSRTSGGWGRILRYTFGAALFLFTAVAVGTGVQWYLWLSGFCTVFIIVIGRRRIFRASVTRFADEIVCRYVPWYEGNAYVLIAALPLLGVAFVGAGLSPDYPVWLRYGGFILLLGVLPLIVYSLVSIWRRNILRITPSTLFVRFAAAPKDGLTEIRRELVQSITPKMIPNSVNGIKSLQVEIAYRPVDLTGETPKTVLLGLYLSVQPINLLNALVVWNDAATHDPSELLDRIERILRGQSTADV
jgi:hypothetical protein